MHTLIAVKLLLLIGATIYLGKQVQRPGRWMGQPIVWLMNRSHSKLTDWGLQHVLIEKAMTILDVGCGGGRTIQKLAKLAFEGKVYGIDHAAGSIAVSRATNAVSIQAGQVQIIQASVSQIPQVEGAFDLVTAVETQYYWPDLVNDMQEILRVLKPGGTLLVIAETYRKGKHNSVLGPAMKLLGSPNLGVEEQRELFEKAGYGNVEVFEESEKGWICVLGRKAIANHTPRSQD